ncbi:MAG TPA: NAD(P)H-dependent oxidoreductase [Verrucomicrobiales bacterium]|nr:NAD(P)H-dependent oxidoreductase [Verrucomicrobiales bacterium]
MLSPHMTTSTPAPIPNEHLLSALRWRYATKQFDPGKKIPAPTWETLEETLVLTPSSFGLQPWKFLILQDAAIREKLVPHSWGQRQVADASHLVVMAVKTQITAGDIDAYLQDTARTRGIPVDSLAGFRKMLVGSILEGPISKQIPEWATRQAYIALGNLMTAAALLGIDTCPMEGFEPARYDEILGLGARGLTTAVLCPVGYRASGDKYATLAKVRFPRNQVVEHLSQA